ncbi:hypothetical protein Z043_104914, partial [Scleropages formosus]
VYNGVDADAGIAPGSAGMTRHSMIPRHAKPRYQAMPAPDDRRHPLAEKEFAAPPPLLFRKLSNPDLSPAAGKARLQRQLSQDDSRDRRNSMASGLTGKQLLPLSSSLHGGVSQLVQPPSGEPNNLVRMRSQALGQSAPSLTAGL